MKPQSFWLLTLFVLCGFPLPVKAANLLVNLKPYDGRYFVVAEGGGCEGSVVNANRGWARQWETFTLIDRDLGPLQTGHRVHFKTDKGCFVVAEGGGGREVRADREVAAEWETFIIEKVAGSNGDQISPDDYFSLKTFDGQFYVTAQGCGGGSVRADQKTRGNCETFQLKLVGDGVPPASRLSGPFESPNWFYVGPQIDYDEANRDNPDCRDYLGREDFPHCYDGHEGGDFPLVGGFPAMDSPKFMEITEIVAVAPGYVVSFDDDEGDRCYSRPDPDHPTEVEIYCPHEGQVPGRDSNNVIVRQDDGLLALYWHCMADTVPWEVGDRIECGDTICRAASSGQSSAPHLHFELRKLSPSNMDSLATPEDFRLFKIRSTSTIVDPYNDLLWWTRDARGVPLPVCGSHAEGLCAQRTSEVRCDLSSAQGRACSATGGQPRSLCRGLCRTLRYTQKVTCPEPPAPPPAPPPPPPARHIGESCSITDLCEVGLVCDRGTCKQVGVLVNGSCDQNHLCAPTLQCRAGVCRLPCYCPLTEGCTSVPGQGCMRNGTSRHCALRCP